jgi:RNA-binding protein YhbY
MIYNKSIIEEINKKFNKGELVKIYFTLIY